MAVRLNTASFAEGMVDVVFIKVVGRLGVGSPEKSKS